MLDDAAIDCIFEATWKEYTSYSNSRPEFLSLYLKRLGDAIPVRSERTRIPLQSYIRAVKARPEVRDIDIRDNKFTVSFPDATFAITTRSTGDLLLKVPGCDYTSHVFLWDPREAAQLMALAGCYKEKAGTRWVEFHRAKELEEIESKFQLNREELLERYAESLVPGSSTVAKQKEILEEFTTLLTDVAAKKKAPIQQSEIDQSMESFFKDAEIEKNRLIKKRETADKAKARRLAKKEKEEQLYEKELQHLTEKVGVPPLIISHKPLYDQSYLEYCFQLSNGQTVSFRDYDKSPVVIEKKVVLILDKLEGLIPYLAAMLRCKRERRWQALTSAMIKKNNQKVLADLGDESPFCSLIRAFNDRPYNVSFSINARTFVCQYYFDSNRMDYLHLSLPRTLDSEQVERLAECLKSFIRADNAMRNIKIQKNGKTWICPGGYEFDVPMTGEVLSKGWMD